MKFKTLICFGVSGGAPAFAFSVFAENFGSEGRLLHSVHNELAGLYIKAFPGRVAAVDLPRSCNRPLAIVRSVCRTIKIGRQSRDVLITAYHPVLFLVVPLLAIFGVKTSYILHDVEPHSSSWVEETFQLLINLMRVRVMVVSGAQADRFCGKFGKMPEIIKHPPYLHYKYYTGLEEFTFSPVPFLFLGRLEPYKGLSLLEGLGDCGVTDSAIVRIAGKGTVPDRLGSQEGLDLMIGYVADYKIPALISACSYLILPYVDATQSGLFQLANTFGKPILATPLQVFKEQSRYCKVPVYFSEEVSKESFQKLLKEHLRNEQ